MATTKYYLSCDTIADLDIIKKLDSMSSPDRKVFIKVAIRQYEIAENPTEKLDKLEEIMANVLRELHDLKKTGLKPVGNSDTINNDIDSGEIKEAEGNLKKAMSNF